MAQGCEGRTNAEENHVPVGNKKLLAPGKVHTTRMQVDKSKSRNGITLRLCSTESVSRSDMQSKKISKIKQRMSAMLGPQFFLTSARAHVKKMKDTRMYFANTNSSRMLPDGSWTVFDAHTRRADCTHGCDTRQLLNFVVPH